MQFLCADTLDRTVCVEMMRVVFPLQIEQLQTELNKLRYEHSFLQQEYQHERTTHQQVIDEMKLRHEAEVSHLTNQCTYNLFRF